MQILEICSYLLLFLTKKACILRSVCFLYSSHNAFIGTDLPIVGLTKTRIYMDVDEKMIQNSMVSLKLKHVMAHFDTSLMFMLCN